MLSATVLSATVLAATVLALCAAGCGPDATPAGAVILDWHRTSATSEPGSILGEDVGPATEETQSGTLEVGSDEIRYTITLDIGEIRSGGGESLPAILRGPRRIRVRVDEAHGRSVSASCQDALTLTPAAEGDGYGPDLAATCTIQVAPDAVKVFLLRAERDTPSAPTSGAPSTEADAP
ncbi:MAG TPA: hypothetical protein RMH85_35585 [Polyangiaceae bacterium LLY-WYZ-15_(1-7)]|nr:hypothetical protein [Myxococcales bacterium]MBJ71284.1 hypothetical protein [Sandaracinus sp.]HJK91164.1 hypothetical protein [Polyangiaceae bacterium LLY-WYZ-15_(1-7)]HJL05857.1 hypothetical protein [Polyangiaceae bacterium LLY-WYZ-15_(1-7)]HJL13863.1 hypothetical protein [Polyangiaceae bacterium LLY-WYZ-15_(1-7)]